MSHPRLGFQGLFIVARPRLLRAALGWFLFSFAIMTFSSPGAMAKTSTMSTRIAEPLGASPTERQLRIATPRGGIRILQPKSATPPRAVILYVHGYGSSVDDTWHGYGLVSQFRQSGINALFVSVEAPAGPGDTVRFRRLEAVLDHVSRRLGKALPKHLVAMGHSGAYRTILPWLRSRRLRHVILLDALYSNGTRFAAWLRRAPNHRLTVVSHGKTPTRNGRRLAKLLAPYARFSKRVPSFVKGFSLRQKRARVLFIRARCTHLRIVTGARTIPVILRDRVLSSPPRGRQDHLVATWRAPFDV